MRKIFPHIPLPHLSDADLPWSALGHQARFFSPPLRHPAPAILLPRVLQIFFSNHGDTAGELCVSQGFVLRRVSRLGEFSRIHNSRLRRKYVTACGLLTEVQIDEMEAYEDARLKPLSIRLSMTHERFIIRTDVATITAKG